jgi:hypothetical protein
VKWGLLRQIVTRSQLLLLDTVLAGSFGCQPMASVGIHGSGVETSRGVQVARQSEADHPISTAKTTGKGARVGLRDWPEPFGPSGPVRVDRVAVNQSWVSWCNVRSSHLTLTWSDGRSQSLTAVLGQSVTGNAVAIAVGDTWQVVDTASRNTIDLNQLGIDRRLNPTGSGARSIVFHPTLPIVALLLRRDEHSLVSLLDTSDERQLSIFPSSREVYRVAWEPSGDYLLLDEIPEDTNGNHRLDWPEPELSRPASICDDAMPRFVTAGSKGDRLVTTIGARTGGAAIPANGAVQYGDHSWFAITPDRQVTINDATHAVEATPKTCDAHLVASHGTSRQLLIGCLEKSRLALGLVSQHGYRPLGIDMPYAEDFDRRTWSERFLPIYSGTSTYLVDFERSTAITLLERDQLLAQLGANVVVRRGSTIVRLNAGDSSAVVLATSLEPGTRIVLGKRVAWVDPYVVGADPEFVTYLLPHNVAALSEQGCALVYTKPADPPNHPQGPLRWLCGRGSVGEKNLPSDDTESFETATP